MTNELICSLIAMACYLIVAIKLLSDRISERTTKNRKVKTLISIVLSLYASFRLAVLAEHYCSPKFNNWRICIVAYAIFCTYFVVSAVIGLHEKEKDEEKQKDSKNQ